MESPRKYNDCYFYYYSTCTKGDNCVFRHEPTALGCETMCPLWQQGKCLDKRCKLRHMELRKNRKQIPCYWENQPGGCRKKHCPFQHKHPEARTDGIAPAHPYAPVANAVAPSAVETTEPQVQPQQLPPAPIPAPAQGMVLPHELLWQQQQRQVVIDSAILGVLPASAELLGRRVLPAPHDPSAQNPYAPVPVDPLVVNFEEESDNESAPSSTPTKLISPDELYKSVPWKTQELLLLERIQAEAAAYYSYDEVEKVTGPKLEPVIPDKRTVRTNISSKYDRLSLDEISGRPQIRDIKRSSLDFKVLSLEEIRARKKVNNLQANKPNNPEGNVGRKRKSSTHDTILVPHKVIKVVSNNTVVYKKADDTCKVTSAIKVPEGDSSRKRKASLESDVLEIHDDELNVCLKTMSTNLSASKVRKVAVKDKTKALKLKLIRKNTNELGHKSTNNLDLNSTNNSCQSIDVGKNNSDVQHSEDINENNTNTSSEVKIVSNSGVEVCLNPKVTDPICTDDAKFDTSVTDLEDNDKNVISKDTLVSTELKDIVEVRQDSISSEIDNSLNNQNIPDVVASCHSEMFITKMPVYQSAGEGSTQILKEIDSILNEDAL